MYTKLVKDIMIPVADYPTIHQDATLKEAIKILREAQKDAPRPVQRFRAVLALNDDNKIVGKVCYLSFLRALEPKYYSVFDLDKLTRASLSSNFVDSLFEQFSLWDDDSFDLCKIAETVKVKEIMNPVEENIDEIK